MKTKSNTLTYLERAEICCNPTAQKLFRIMDRKQSNLAVNIDSPYKKDILDLADKAGPHICLLKTHVDILTDFDEGFVSDLLELADKHQFLIFEDRKFADIGSIAKLQYQKGIYKISEWADITNAHVVAGPGIIQGLKEVGLPLGRGLLLLAEMSSSGSLAKGSYTEAAIKMAEEYSDFVIGFICQRKLVDDPKFIHMTPGVKLVEGQDSLGQQYKTPETVIKENGSDLIIVGRGITQSVDPAAESERYREAGIKAATV